MKDAVIGLLKIKSIVTIMLSLVFCYLAIVGTVNGEQFLIIFTMIIAFYYGTQNQKQTDKVKDIIDEIDVK